MFPANTAETSLFSPEAGVSDFSLNPSSPKNAVKGVWPAMLTPFRADGAIDEEALRHLTRFYLQSGASGLLAACWSSEIEFLSFNELADTLRIVCKETNGAVPIAATPHAEEDATPLEGRIETVFSSGADIVVLIANRFAQRDESDDALIERLLALVDKFPSERFGLYECPTPYHRHLSIEALSELAKTGRFHFHKDTSCDINIIRQKIAAIQGTPLCFLNAHSPTLFESLQAGGYGYSGIGANFYPEVYVELCQAVADHKDERARDLHEFLSCAEAMSGNDSYPVNAKTFLKSRGVPLEAFCRMGRTMSPQHAGLLNDLALLSRNFF